MTINPADFNHPDDYARAFTQAHPGYFATYFSSLIVSWEITKETAKAVLVGDELWLPKSQVIIDSGRVIGVRNTFYSKIARSASRHIGF